MLTRFTHILLFMIATGELFTSCSSDAPDVGSNDSEMQFVVSDASRASVTTNINQPGYQFSIFGDKKFVDSSSPENIVIFDGNKVTYNDSKWTYANPQYWFPQHEHSFVAKYPVEVAEVSNIAYLNNRLSFDYTLPENYKDAQDLLVATHRRMYDGVTSGLTLPIMLKFIHIMSKINFVVKNDNAAETVKVNKIELKGVNQSGTFAITPAALLSGSKQTDDYTLAWTGQTNKRSLIAAVEVDIPDSGVRSLFPDDNAMFIIPQPDNNDISMTISYTLIYTDGRTEEQTLVATTTIGGWEPEKVYTYSITITPITKVIELTVSVTDWKEGNNDGVSVPRK